VLLYSERGNGMCTCRHITQLDSRVAALENARAQAPAGTPQGDGAHRRDPFIGGVADVPHDPGAWGEPRLIEAKPLNMLSGDKFSERPLFDEKVASSSGCQCDGSRGGVAREVGFRGYFISNAHAPCRHPRVGWGA